MKININFHILVKPFTCVLTFCIGARLVGRGQAYNSFNEITLALKNKAGAITLDSANIPSDVYLIVITPPRPGAYNKEHEVLYFACRSHWGDPSPDSTLLLVRSDKNELHFMPGTIIKGGILNPKDLRVGKRGDTVELVYFFNRERSADGDTAIAIHYIYRYNKNRLVLLADTAFASFKVNSYLDVKSALSLLPDFGTKSLNIYKGLLPEDFDTRPVSGELPFKGPGEFFITFRLSMWDIADANPLLAVAFKWGYRFIPVVYQRPEQLHFKQPDVSANFARDTLEILFYDVANSLRESYVYHMAYQKGTLYAGKLEEKRP